MTPAERERLAALEQALARVMRQQEEILDRLARLDGEAAPAAPEPLAAPPEPAAEPEPEPLAAEPPAALPAEPARPRVLETRMGLTWINRIGVITLVLGVAFFFKYAVENRWIGETARVLLGLAAGTGALVLADRLWRGGQRIYAQGVAGAGIGILYVSLYAAYGLYQILGQAAAFLLMAATTGAAGALALRYRAAAIAGLGLLGGYATPLVLNVTGSPWFLLSYVLLLDAGAIAVSRERGWRAVEALALAATAVLYTTTLSQPMRPERRLVSTVFPLAYYALFAALPSRALFFPLQALVGLALAVVWTPLLLPYAVLAPALAGAGLGIADRRDWASAALITSASFWISFLTWRQAGQPAGPVFLLLTAALALFLAWLPWRVLARGRSAGVLDLLVLALAGPFYFGAAHDVLHRDFGSVLGLLAVALALAHMGVSRAVWQRDARAALLGAGVAWSFLVLAAPIQFSGYRVTMVWSAEAAALAWIGARMRERRAIHGALFIYALVLLRLAGVDSGMYGWPHAYAALANPRFLTFAAAAAAGWGAAFWIRSGAAAGATYVGGHFVMLWGLILEALGWAARSAPENLRNLESTAISILAAGYALMLVALGIAGGAGINRILGLGLIAGVIAKLYLWDVWSLGLSYRMAAFAALGALLLAMSYLYSRHGRSIEAWWRERNQREARRDGDSFQ